MTTAPSTAELGPFDPESRALCSDDLCLGLITAEGRCNVCGKPGVPPSVSADASSSSSSIDEGDEADEDGRGDRADSAGARSADSDSGFDAEGEDRTLCSDDSCIGVLGSDGRCKVCGKSAEPTVAI